MGRTRRDVATHAPRARTGAPRQLERFSRRDHAHAQLHSEVAEWKLLDLTRADMERYAMEAALEAAAAEPEYDYGVGGPVVEEPLAEDVGVGGPVVEEPPAEEDDHGVGGGDQDPADEDVPEEDNGGGAEDDDGPDHGVGIGGGDQNPAVPSNNNGGGRGEGSEDPPVPDTKDDVGAAGSGDNP